MKQGKIDKECDLVESRPFTGAWIETASAEGGDSGSVGRPFTGAWIETGVKSNLGAMQRSPLHGGVD